MAYSSVYMRAMLLNPRMSPFRMRLPASQFRGESAFGAMSSAITARHTYDKVQAGLQSVLRMSRQSSPVFHSTFGWKIFVRKVTVGGESGYCGGQTTDILNLPPENGLSGG